MCTSNGNNLPHIGLALVRIFNDNGDTRQFAAILHRLSFEAMKELSAHATGSMGCCCLQSQF